jgi:hypothetical protein
MRFQLPRPIEQIISEADNHTVKNRSLAFYGTRKFIAVLTIAGQLSLF